MYLRISKQTACLSKFFFCKFSHIHRLLHVRPNANEKVIESLAQKWRKRSNDDLRPNQTVRLVSFSGRNKVTGVLASGAVGVVLRLSL